jgi:hypothetical protein
MGPNRTRKVFHVSISSSTETERAAHQIPHDQPGQKRVVWSCSFFPGIRSAYCLPDRGNSKSFDCLYCGVQMFDTGTNWTEKLIHLVVIHRYRDCSQELYASQSEFERHLSEYHRFTPHNRQERSELDSAITFQPHVQPGMVLDAVAFPFLDMAEESSWEPANNLLIAPRIPTSVSCRTKTSREE